jgi:hypothetical protein
MTAQYMNVALKHPHPDFPFSTIGDDTITALAALADIFKNKFQKPLAPTLSQQSPVTSAQIHSQACLSNKGSFVY